MSTLPPQAATPDFDQMYQADPDPWSVETSWYERRKLAVLLATLPLERYGSAWEPGCGPGIVSAALGHHVDHLVASDSSATAIGLARGRPGLPDGVHFVQSALPEVPVNVWLDSLPAMVHSGPIRMSSIAIEVNATL